MSHFSGWAIHYSLNDKSLKYPNSLISETNGFPMALACFLLTFILKGKLPGIEFVGPEHPLRKDLGDAEFARGRESNLRGTNEKTGLLVFFIVVVR